MFDDQDWCLRLLLESCQPPKSIYINNLTICTVLLQHQTVTGKGHGVHHFCAYLFRFFMKLQVSHSELPTEFNR